MECIAKIKSKLTPLGVIWALSRLDFCIQKDTIKQ